MTTMLALPSGFYVGWPFGNVIGYAGLVVLEAASSR